MHKKHEQMAVVVDEYGGAVGIYYHPEDISEEIVGTIDDKYRKGERLYQRIGPGRYLVSGRMEIEKFEQILFADFPEGNYGNARWLLSIGKWGEYPSGGERINYNGITFIIENADQKSIKEVLVIFPPPLDKMETK